MPATRTVACIAGVRRRVINTGSVGGATLPSTAINIGGAGGTYVASIAIAGKPGKRCDGISTGAVT